MIRKLIITGLLMFILAAALTACAGGPGNLHVKVVGDNNTPLPGFKVISNEQPSGQLKVTGMTGIDGTVTYNDIKAGEYNFYVNGAGYEQKTFDVNVTRGKTARYYRHFETHFPAVNYLASELQQPVKN